MWFSSLQMIYSKTKWTLRKMVKKLPTGLNTDNLLPLLRQMKHRINQITRERKKEKEEIKKKFHPVVLANTDELIHIIRPSYQFISQAGLRV